MSAAPDDRGQGIWALVPVKPFQRGKSRLATTLAPDARADFARSLFERVLGVLTSSPDLAGTLVVTSCPEAAALARAKGAAVLDDPASTALGAIVDAGLAELRARGAAGALVLMADLPLLDGRAIHRVVQAMGEFDLVIVPDFREEGTNALGMTPPARLATSFGTHDSFRRHGETGRAAALRVGVHRDETVEFDVDGPEDYALLDGRKGK